MEHILYWLWLTLKNGMTPLRAEMLVRHFGTVENIYNAPDCSEVEGLDAGIALELRDKRLTKALGTYKRVRELGADVIPIDSPDYPEVLRNIPKSPYVLYIRGSVPDWDRLFTVGVVGTRRCSDYGKTVTRDICANLVENGAVIVSGMAVGIDSAAAWAALDAGGKTIAVLGSGIDVIYPKSNASLYGEICKNGCIISEYPPGSEPSRWKFPQRNRIIAALSCGVLVTEAAEGSGSLITAREALNIGRRLYAVPGEFFHESYYGDTTVIQRKARLINRAEDILEDLGGIPSGSGWSGLRNTSDAKPSDIMIAADAYRHEDGAELNEPKPNRADRTAQAKQNNENKRGRTADTEKTYSAAKIGGLSDFEKQILGALRENEASTDELARTLNVPVFRLNAALTMLELGSFVKRLPGNRFKLIIK